MTLCPARLEPTFSARPWGALSLAPFFPQMTRLADPIGEAWMTGNESVFANGPFAGRKLGDAWPQMPIAWTGTAIRRNGVFPILTKFLFCEEKLSIQVHPDDDYASAKEAAAGGTGKTEMWYVLRARLNAEVLVGLKPDATAEGFRRAIAEGSAENCLERVRMKEGEAIFIPAGTAHTIGDGLVICEIQQHSDLTYRVFDYNRRDAQGRTRELHVDKALRVMRFGAQTCGKLDPVRAEREGAKESYFVACPYFATEKWEFTAPISRQTSAERFELLIVLEGTGTIASDDCELEYAPAQTWLMPAALRSYRLTPSNRTALLRTYAPGDLKDFAAQLAARGIDADAVTRLARF